jgi:hypothetical protein
MPVFVRNLQTHTNGSIQKPPQCRPSPSEEIIHAEMYHANDGMEAMTASTLRVLANSDTTFTEGSEGDYEEFIKFLNKKDHIGHAKLERSHAQAHDSQHEFVRHLRGQADTYRHSTSSK